MVTTKQQDRNQIVPMIPKEREFRYRLIQGVFRVIFHTICKVRVEGLEKLPRQGPLIMYSNHLHLFDAPIIFSVLPVRGTVMAAEKWENHVFLGPLLKSINAVFINRGAADRTAIRKVQALLEQGAIVAIAPEGTRSKTGGLQEGKGGAALLASKTGATLAPLVVYGHEKWFEPLRRFRRAEVVVRFGDSFTLPSLQGGNKSQQVADMTQNMMLRLARLLPPAYRGVYRSLVPENDVDGEV
jgi:1-acyl-sn-glycerol-3-phosphate acyltransferase